MSKSPSRTPTIVPTKSTYFPTTLPSSTRTAKSVRPSARSTQIPLYTFNDFLIVSSINATSSSPALGARARPTQLPTASPSLMRSKTYRPSRAPTLVNDISYHNNQSVMTGPVKAYNIFLGDYSTSESRNSSFLLNYLASNLASTSWYRILTNNYYQIQNGVKTYVSKTLTVGASVFWPQLPPRAATETDFIDVIIDAFNSGLPVDGNGIYTIFFRGNISPIITINGNKISWLKDWCSYHGAFRLKYQSTVFKFAVVGDPNSSNDLDNAPRCTSPITTSPNKNYGGDNMAGLFASQIANVMTNPTSSTWYINGLMAREVATACSWRYGTLMAGGGNVVVGMKTYLLQQLWVPRFGCALSA